MNDIKLDICSIDDNTVAEEWKSIYSGNPSLSVFSSYGFNLLFVKLFCKNPRRKGSRIIIVRAKNPDGETFMFLPLCERHGDYYMMWDCSSVPFCDAVYKSGSDSALFEAVLIGLSSIIGNSTVYFTRMRDDSDFTKYLLSAYTPYKKRKGEKVVLLRTFESTYAMTERTFKDSVEGETEELSRAALSYSADFFFDRELPPDVERDIFNLSCSSDGFFYKIRKRRIEKISPLLQYIKSGENNFTAVFCVAGKRCAFAEGFVKGDTLTVVRTGFKGERGSRIISMVWRDIMKYCIEKRQLKYIDLCRNKSDIKSDLNSVQYSIVNFEIKL